MNTRRLFLGARREPTTGSTCTNRTNSNHATLVVLFGTKQLLSKVLDIRVLFLGQYLIPVSSVEDLGIILDSNLTFNEHVNTLTSSLISILCQISRLRHLFSKSVLIAILNCLVFCKLFFFFIARQSGPERLRTT